MRKMESLPRESDIGQARPKNLSALRNDQPSGMTKCETVEIIAQAELVHRQFRNGKSIIEIASENENANFQAFGIGQLLNHLERNNCLNKPFNADKILNDASGLAKRDKDLLLRRAPISRQRFIGYLERLGYIDLQTKPNKTIRRIKPVATTPSASMISLLIQKKYGVPYDEIKSENRSRTITGARFRMIWVLFNICGLSLKMVGEKIGGRDHTTVLSAINFVRQKIEDDEAVKAELAQLCEASDALGVLHCLATLRTHYQFIMTGRSCFENHDEILQRLARVEIYFKRKGQFEPKFLKDVDAKRKTTGVT